MVPVRAGGAPEENAGTATIATHRDDAVIGLARTRRFWANGHKAPVALQPAGFVSGSQLAQPGPVDRDRVDRGVRTFFLVLNARDKRDASTGVRPCSVRSGVDVAERGADILRADDNASVGSVRQCGPQPEPAI